MTYRSRAAKELDPNLRRTRTIFLNAGDPESKRSEIRAYFHATYDIDEALFELLRFDDAFYLRADPLRHPLIFYFGHTAVFHINKLILAKLINRRIHPSFESMFAVGVDEMSWDDLDETHYHWPPVSEVQDYRNRVRNAVDQVIESLPLTMPIDWDSPWWVLMMGIEHARIHLETSSVLIRQLPIDQVRPHPFWKICRDWGPAPANELIDVPGGQVVLGKDKSDPLYGWDNEFGTASETIADFRASRYLVSNQEYLAFVKDQGYTEPRWWTEEGWKWRSYKQAQHPIFWIPANGSFRLRTVAEEIDMPWNWPVEVNYLEAKAYCNWFSEKTAKTIRLPTEPEWVHLRDRCVPTDQPYWEHAPGNINLEHYASSCPVTQFAFSDFHDVIGNVWQWTETPISGYSGFEVHPYYDDFSVPTFDGLHNLIKGGSWISTGNEATRNARYAFRRHFFQHAGFRYVESDQPVSSRTDACETDPEIASLCAAHYGNPMLDVPNYYKAISRLCTERMAGRPRAKALDIGCTVGRATFELAREFEQVLGLDLSARYIRLGSELKETGSIHYTLIEEGELSSYHEVALADLGLDAFAQRVQFEQADPCNLKEFYTGYDLVLAANLIDRLNYPDRFLATIHERIQPGGLLVVASSYAWDESITKKEDWIGGIRVAGEPRTTLDGLHALLRGHFQPVGDPVPIPSVHRMTRRRYLHSINEVTVWERLT